MVACSPALPEPERRPAALVEAPPVATTAPSGASELDLVARHRELVPRLLLAPEKVDRQELLTNAFRQVDSDSPKEVLGARSRILSSLGLVDEGFDFRGAIESVLRTTLVGLYDPESRRLLIADDISVDDATMTRIHELGHGLVDQHFDLASRFGYRQDDSDRSAAISALAEGDATSLMFDVLSDLRDTPRAELARDFMEAMQRDVPVASGVPLVIQRLMAAPYIDGFEFVERVRAAGGWSAVDDAWRTPPLTTEQLLHPDKFEVREPRVEVRVTAPRPDCQLEYTDVLGEQTIGVLLSTWANPTRARELASGWDGDRVAVFECAGEAWVTLGLAWRDSSSLALLIEAFRDGVSRTRCTAGVWRATDSVRAQITLPPADGCAFVRLESAHMLGLSAGL